MTVESDDYGSGLDDEIKGYYTKYKQSLLSIVEAGMARWLKQRYPAEDVVNSAFKSFMQEYRSKGPMGEPQEVWNLLVKIAKRKISKQARYWSAQKRDWERLGNDDVEHLSADERQDSEHACFKMFEELEKVLTPRQLVIVKLLLEGYSQAKIGEKLGFSEKTVNREILKIRERLNDMREEDGDGIES